MLNRPATAGQARPPLRDNPRLILIGILLLLVALVAMVALADRSASLSPDFLSEVVLYALSAADLTMLVALVFVLARNIIKLLVERRRALPFARFRAKLVAAMLGLTLIPAVLVLIVGSELIRNSADRWFSAPIDEVLASANEIASDYYYDRQLAVSDHAERIARSLTAMDLTDENVSVVLDLLAPEVTGGRVEMVQVYRVTGDETAPPSVAPVVDVAAPELSREYSRVAADRLAARVAGGSSESRTVEPLSDGGDLVRAAAVVRAAPDGPPIGVVVASDQLTGELARHSHRIAEAYEAYNQLRVLKRPLAGVYLSFFLMVTLCILVGATWMGMFIAKRIMRPVHMLADGARAIEAGHLDHRVEPETADEFGSLVEAFNSMADGLAASQRKLERSQSNLQRKNVEVEGRRRYIETILERIATGVVSIDARGIISTVNGAAARLLGLERSVVGQPAVTVFMRSDLHPLGALLRGLESGSAEQSAQEVALARDAKTIHLAVAATTLQSETGGRAGAVMVFDDVTPLIRAQRIATWRDVARRLAHEIRNPLTPIQLCAERMRRHFTGAPPPVRSLVDECTSTIVGEVESLKALVDEFSQFARMPGPRTLPVDLHGLLNDALGLYDGLFQTIRIDRRYAPDLPRVRVDPEQMRRVVINLVDNAVEILRDGSNGVPSNGDPGVIVVATEHDVGNGVVRFSIADNGPGIAPADREKLFMPYYSTKQRGSGLGLAIVRRIIVEHGGSIEVGDNGVRGTTFTIELPC